MNVFSNLRRAILLVTLVVIGTITAQAETVILPDGTLAESANAQTGVGIQQTLGPEFNAANGPMTFSGTISRTPETNLGFSQYNLGMTVGNVYFLVHPGYDTSEVDGAFRFDAVDLTTSLVSPGAYTGNLNIGYVVDASPIDFTVVLMEAFTDSGVDFYSMKVTIEQGANSFSDTYSLEQDAFGAGGTIGSFGAFHNGFGTGYGAVNYSGFTASVPEVSAQGALAAIGSIMAMMAFLWERRRLLPSA